MATQDNPSTVSRGIKSTITISQYLPRLFGVPHRIPVLRGESKDTQSGPFYDERHLKRLLWYLLGGTRGGPNRADIIKTLHDRPCNANQLAEILRVDYKTIQHHVKILEENGLIAASNKGSYGAILFLTPKMEDALPILDEIWSRIGRRKISATTTE